MKSIEIRQEWGKGRIAIRIGPSVYISSTLGTWQQKPRPSGSAGQILSGSNLWPGLVRPTVVDVVHAAIDALERQEFLRGLNGDYQRLRNDPELWAQYLTERKEWDALA